MAIKDEYQSIKPRYPELKGQVAIITGGAKGIGQGIALRLGREGMQLVIADFDGESLATTAASLKDLGVQVLAFEGDLSQSTVIEQLFKMTQQTFNRVDLLVNNAADLERGRLLDEQGALLEQQLATNIGGPYLCSIQAAKMMKASGGGNIIHISSVGAVRAHWKAFPYDVTKGAINAMTKAMAIDLAEYNIRVNAIGPGATKTYRTGGGENTAVSEIANRIPLKRFGLVSEMSSVIAFLASPEASYITGQIIYVDGGITAQLSPPGQKL
ncbi:MAG: SDR family NAD(P)-dependent oxidoreductase [Chloroflexi bacterium]|nr:MAG: SDR family NAD(P)-dependent oxidoreductase [Chloroflexota bacterium]